MRSTFKWGLEINLELAKRVLSVHDDTASITVEDIQRLVADHYRVRVADLKSANRSKPLVTARQVAMYLIKKNLDKSLVEVGRHFGGKDHTTVINALKRVESQLSKDSDLKKDVDELRKEMGIEQPPDLREIRKMIRLQRKREREKLASKAG